MERKPVKSGLDYLRDEKWDPIRRNRAGAIREGSKRMPEYLKRYRFGVAVCDCGEYYRVIYGK